MNAQSCFISTTHVFVFAIRGAQNMTTRKN
jgi:hypothetical protein